MGRNALVDMTNMLYEQAQRLYQADSDDVEREVERSKALDGLATGIRSNIGTQLAVEKFRQDYGIKPPIHKQLAADNG